MLYSTFVSGAALAMLQVLPAHAMPKIAGRTAPSHKGPMPGYGIEDITWELQTDSGTTVNVTGTIQQVMQYAEKNKIVLKRNNNVSSSNIFSSSPWDNKDSSLACNNKDRGLQENLARTDAIKWGILHLRKVTRKPLNGPGPGNCGRVSYSYRAAIWWCNENREPKELGSFSYIADGTQVILDNCPHYLMDAGYIEDLWEPEGIQGTHSMPDG